MSVTIRLAREGKKNAPSYKVVVSNTKDKRNGKFLDILGHYNPSHTPTLISIDEKKIKDWQSKGALITKSVEKILKGEYTYVKYDPKGAKAQKEQAA